jgi:cellulose 1,4-beta-cellobiosidase
MKWATRLLLSGIAVMPVSSQLPGLGTVEEHPPLLVHYCTKALGCIPKSKAVVIDANWRWIHDNKSVNCYDHNQWSSTLCPDVETCAKKCHIEGISRDKYNSTYGVTTDVESVRLNFVSSSGNVGSRLYLMDTDAEYESFKLLNRELAFDVDVSMLPCGVNGAVYFVQMDSDGGMARYAGNKAGAAYGAGYCDAQCPRDVKFINGEPNILDWGPIPGVPNSGVGKYGSCCVEMDVWEANSRATAYTPHPCNTSKQTRCEDPTSCGEGDARDKGLCDKDGCDMQTYRLGKRSFYGRGASFDVDSTRPFTIVTQFVTDDHTDDGSLTEIRRHYIQDGKKIPTPTVSFSTGPETFDSITAGYCSAEVSAFNASSTFDERGGMRSMGDAAKDGMVLVLSLWDDYLSHMLWLDSTVPPNSTKPGAARGPCPTDSGDPGKLEPGSKAYVTYSRIRFGEIGTTDEIFSPAPPMPPSPPPPPLCAKAYAQCGGKTPDGRNWTGPSCCPPGYNCTGNPYYKGCTPCDDHDVSGGELEVVHERHVRG